MDTLPIIIVTAVITAFINGAVSIAIFRRVEENIKLDFQKQLETFKTELQKGVIEHQVKFSKTYPKTLEVLETFIGLFKEYVSVCSSTVPIATINQDGKVTFQVTFTGETEKIVDRLNKCKAYFDENRFYLADTIADEINGILGESDRLSAGLKICGDESRSSNHMSLAGWIRLTFLFKIPSAVERKDANSLVTVVKKLHFRLCKLLDRLEHLYKTVALAD